MIESIKPTNYSIFYDWMITDLKLKGTDLLIYSIILSFTVSKRQKFYGTISYLAKRVGVTKDCAYRSLKKLCSKNKDGEGLLIKEIQYINNVKYCYYRVALNQLKKEYFDQLIIIE